MRRNVPLSACEFHLKGILRSHRRVVGYRVSIGVGRKSVDLGVAFVKRPVLALELEQEGLNLPKRSAFNGVANLGDEVCRYRVVCRALAVSWPARLLNCESTGRAAACFLKAHYRARKRASMYFW
jgi:hypothetical protein